MNAVRPLMPSVQMQHKPEASHKGECFCEEEEGGLSFPWALETKNIFLRFKTAAFALMPLVHQET